MHDFRQHIWPVKAESGRAISFQAGVLLVVATLYAVNQLLLKGLSADTPLAPFFGGYFDDLLAPAALLALSNIVFALRGFQATKPLYVMLVTLAAAILWEYLAPLLNPASTTDILDVAAYLAGGCAYLLVVRFTGCWAGQQSELQGDC